VRQFQREDGSNFCVNVLRRQRYVAADALRPEYHASLDRRQDERADKGQPEVV